MNIERLEKVATHLETGKLGHKVFDFTTVNGAYVIGTCGTNGCAIGEFPFIFKNDWKFAGYGIERKQNRLNFQLNVGRYLNITPIEATFLFVPPNIIRTGRFGHILLAPNSTRYDVAKRIRRFIDYMLHHTLDAREAQAKKDRDFGIAQRAMRMRMIKAHEKQLVC